MGFTMTLVERMVTVSKSSMVVLVGERESLTSGSGIVITGDGRGGGDGGT